MNNSRLILLCKKNNKFKFSNKLENIKITNNNKKNTSNIELTLEKKKESTTDKLSNSMSDLDLGIALSKLDLSKEEYNTILNNNICSKQFNNGYTELDELDDLVSSAIKSVGGNKIIKNNGNGNCLFNTLSYHLKIPADQLRDDSVMYISVKWERFKHFMLNSDSLEPFQNKEEFVKTMSKKGSWGDHTSLLALCELYQINAILIVTNNSKLSDPITINVGSTRTVLIKFNSEFHYEAIE